MGTAIPENIRPELPSELCREHRSWKISGYLLKFAPSTIKRDMELSGSLHLKAYVLDLAVLLKGHLLCVADAVRAHPYLLTFTLSLLERKLEIASTCILFPGQFSRYRAYFLAIYLKCLNRLRYYIKTVLESLIRRSTANTPGV